MTALGSDKKDLAERNQQNIQEGFLNNARREKSAVTIYLVNGVKISGRIRSFDKFSLILESNHQEQLIFKHAISTVLVHRTEASATPQNTTEE